MNKKSKKPKGGIYALPKPPRGIDGSCAVIALLMFLGASLVTSNVGLLIAHLA